MKLLNLRHNWPSGQHLSHEATSAPKINTYSIIIRPEKQLRGPIPKRHNSASQMPSTPRIEEISEPKISDLQHPVPIDEQIGALDISVQNTALVAMLKAR